MTTASAREVQSSPTKSTSLDNYVCERGESYPSPENMDGSSYVYMGPSYYLPTERRWVSVNDYNSLPVQTRKAAILFESVEDWKKYQDQRETQSRGFYDIPAKFPTSYSPVIGPYRQTAWNRRWNGSGFFVPTENAWIRDQVGPNIPSEAILFYNEEDWLKFKYISENPSIPGAKKDSVVN